MKEILLSLLLHFTNEKAEPERSNKFPSVYQVPSNPLKQVSQLRLCESFRVGKFLLEEGEGSGPVHCRTLSSFSGFYPLGATRIKQL